ncbi:hypothetical protein B1T44_28810, partial [Mycobacterium persicum]
MATGPAVTALKYAKATGSTISARPAGTNQPRRTSSAAGTAVTTRLQIVATSSARAAGSAGADQPRRSALATDAARPARRADA